LRWWRAKSNSRSARSTEARVSVRLSASDVVAARRCENENAWSNASGSTTGADGSDTSPPAHVPAATPGIGVGGASALSGNTASSRWYESHGALVAAPFHW
jgi:hypothetical protein